VSTTALKPAATKTPAVELSFKVSPSAKVNETLSVPAF